MLWQIAGAFVAGPLAVNEIMASNATTVTDPSGEHDDWIEIINVADSSVSLRGKYITDNLTKPAKCALPDTTLPPGGIALIWADDQTAQGRFHAPFKLDKAGEAVGLYDSTSGGFIVMDSVSFGEQATDVSFGRHPDGHGAFAPMTQPTPGRPNILTGTARTERHIPNGYVLHEAYPDPFNPSTTVVFELPTAGATRLAVYDILGREVRTLIQGQQVAGVYRVVFDATGLASGMYVVRLEAGAYVGTQKCMLVR